MAGFYEVNAVSTALPGSEFSSKVPVPDGLEREYTTYVSSGIAAVIAKAGDVILDSDEGDIQAQRKQLRSMAHQFEQDLITSKAAAAAQAKPA